MKISGFKKMLSVVLAVACIMSCFSLTAVVNAKVTDSDSSSANENTIASKASAGDAGKFSWDNATVYFLLTDRWKNGNTSNDHSYNRGLKSDGSVASGIDSRATFHGGDFAGITQTIEEGYFDNLGVNAIWISAAYEQIHGYLVGGDSNPSFAHYSYHGYYVLDYTQTDANFGTAAEFETMVDTAHKHGIRIVMDIVMNHAGYNSLYDMNEYGFGSVKSGWESYYFAHNNVNNTDYHGYIDYNGNESSWANWWGADWIRAGLPGYQAGGNDDITKCLEGLPDFKTDSSATVGIPKLLQTKWNKEGRYAEESAKFNSIGSKTVTNVISYWLSQWVEKYGVDGFRCDTAKHVGLSSWNTLKQSCVSALKKWRQNNPNKPGADWTDDFWMTGEHWDHGVGKDGYYTEGGFDSMINFSTTGGNGLSKSDVSGTYQGYADTINNDDTFNVLSFVSSHDETLTRFGDQRELGSALLLLPGAVQIYYGDETNRPFVEGIPQDGYGGAGHSLRSDMNWNNIDENLLSHWQIVGTFRNNHIAVGAGQNTTVSSTSGSAFTRTYDKNGITDKIAGCVYADANTDVTIDVSNIWEDGHDVMNAYDGSSDTVTNGKVTFNSGSVGTILIQEPDGKPIVSLKGNSTFKDSQVITVSLKECDSAILSIDGGHKFVVKDGDQFEIGKSAYDGDKVKIAVYAENEKGTVNKTVIFIKSYEEGGKDDDPVVESVVYVKAPSGVTPNIYVWDNNKKELLGAWPGKVMEKDSNSEYYKLKLDTKDTYNVIVNNGGSQSNDLEGLYGTTYIDATNIAGATVISTESKGGGSSDSTPTNIRIKMSDGSAPNLYVWDNNKNQLLGAWPGKTLTEKDSDGYYTVTFESSPINAIVNIGGVQTSDITGLSGNVTLEVNASSMSVTKTVEEAPVSGLSLLKQETREIKEMYSYEYTASTWSALKALVSPADEIISQGEDADNSEVEAMITKIQNAKKSLVLAAPVFTNASVGSSTVKGTAVIGSDVTVKIGSKSYTAVADEITGVWSVSTSSLNSSDTLTATCSKNGLSSEALSYSMGSGTINTQPKIPANPVEEYKGGGSHDDDVITYLYGDANLDGEINIKDATLIQKYLVGTESLSDAGKIAANVEGIDISVRSATLIQSYAVNKISSFPAGNTFDYIVPNS